MTRRLLALLTIATIAAASPAAAQEVGGGGDNVAIAVNTKDGSSEFKLSFKVIRTNSDTVDNGNAAVAFGSCEGCETLAVAFQVVLVFSDPSVVTPTNLAIAMNFECESCQTLASAYQFVLGTGGNVHFTPEGNQAIARIRQALKDLLRSDLSIGEIQAELDVLAGDLRTVLGEELVASGPPDAKVEEVPADDGASPAPGGDDPQPTEEPESTPSPDDDAGGGGQEGGSTPSPEPEEDDASPQPSPTEEPSPSPVTTPSADTSPASPEG